jgi:hypothetical protein
MGLLAVKNEEKKKTAENNLQKNYHNLAVMV